MSVKSENFQENMQTENFQISVKPMVHYKHNKQQWKAGYTFCMDC